MHHHVPTLFTLILLNCKFWLGGQLHPISVNCCHLFQYCIRTFSCDKRTRTPDLPPVLGALYPTELYRDSFQIHVVSTRTLSNEPPTEFRTSIGWCSLLNNNRFVALPAETYTPPEARQWDSNPRPRRRPGALSTRRTAPEGTVQDSNLCFRLSAR